MPHCSTEDKKNTAGLTMVTDLVGSVLPDLGKNGRFRILPRTFQNPQHNDNVQTILCVINNNL